MILAVAVALTLLNAVKPVTVDDPAYLRQAAWWAAHPFDPLGGEAFHYQSIVPAAQVASPPVGIAWLALGLRVVGAQSSVLKLWLFPFAWLLAWALHRLLRRMAPSIATPILLMSVLSPALLPSFNLMLDLPALALALAAVAIFVGELKPDLRRSVVAGILAGLALQTKYTAAPALAALLGFGVFAGRVRLGALAVVIALAVFAGLEWLMLASTGDSPLREYLAGRAGRDPGGHRPLLTAKRLLLMFGTAAAAWIPLGLLGLGARRPLVWTATVLPLAGFALLAFAPPRWVDVLDGITHGRVIHFENVAVGWMGPVLAWVAILAVRHVIRVSVSQHSAAAPALAASRTGVAGGALAPALALWFAAECAIAPFVSASASVRRVLGATVALSLLLAWRAGLRVASDSGRAAEVRLLAAAGVLLGLGFWAVDFDSALGERRLLAGVLARVEAAGNRGTIAFVADHWGGFQYEAARAGLRPVALGRSTLAREDLLVVPFGVEMRGVSLDSSHVERVDSLPLIHLAPLTTRRAFYDGRLALRRPDPGWIGASLYSVTRAGPVLLSRPDAR